MFGDWGNIRAIRVICGENGLEDWPQKTRKTESEFLTTDVTDITDDWRYGKYPRDL